MSIQTVAMQPACMPGVYAPRATQKPHFGSFGTAMVSIFQPISENFVWDFTAQDVFALWIPRIITALRRGRHPYDPSEDPQVREGKPFQQWLHTTYMNAKGLNWSNAREESYREFETGPGIFIAPSIVLALGSSAMLGHKALQMSNQDLHRYSEALKKLDLTRLQSADQTARKFFKSLLEESQLGAHLTTPFSVPMPAGTETMNKGLQDLLGKGPVSGQKALKVWTDLILHPEKRVGKLDFLSFEKTYHTPWYQKLGLHSGEQDKMTHLLDRILMTHKDITPQDAINAWTKAWEHAEKKHPFDFVGVRKLNELEAGLKRLTYWVNNQHYPTWSANTLSIPSLVKKSGDTVKVEGVFDNMRKFRGFIRKLYETPNVSKGWAHQIQTLLEHSTVGKAALSILGTLAACATVVLVSAKAQRGRAYPANRNVQLTELPKAEQGKSQATPNTSEAPQWLPIHTTSPWTTAPQPTWNPFNNSWPTATPQPYWPTGGMM